MKYIFSALAFCSLVNLTGCQSNNQEKTAQQETTQDASNGAHAQHPEHAEGAASQQMPPLAKEAAASIPDFKFFKVKSGIGFGKEDIKPGRNTIFVLFDPNCGHCQQEAGILAKNYDKLKNVNIYFVSMNDPALMSSFLETFGKELVDKPNVEVLYDRNQEFIQKIHVPNQFPANYVYGSDGQLKSNWEGDKTVDFILSNYTK